MANKKLFTGFTPSSTQEWEKIINKDLKGADYNKRLITRTIEGIDIKPYYRLEDLSGIEHLESVPGEFPFIRGNKSNNSKHKIRQDIIVKQFEDANKKACELISKGITSLGFIINRKENLTKEEFFILLEKIDIENIEINFISAKAYVNILEYLKAFCIEKNINPKKIVGSLDFDPLGHKTITGHCSKEGHFDFSGELKSLIDSDINDFPNLKVLNINAQHFRNAGSTAVQELAFGMAMGAEYLTLATNAGIEAEQVSPKMMFTFGIASNYFMEIAKIRAARVLWAKIVEAFGTKEQKSGKMYIHSVTCDWNKTAYDPFVNVLRTTTESMSALLGGTDSLLVSPYNSSFEKPDELSERIAGNTQIILNEEAYFDKPVDPAAGSYYIESLTNSLAEHAWKLFLEIEKEGGYHEAFEKGFIKDKIEKTALQRNMNIAQRKEILLGTNQYPNRNETVKLINKPTKAVSGNAIKLYRASEAFEELRQKSENAKKTPKVFMLTMGNLAMRKARATFAGNFFACAGFEIIENTGFKTIDEAVEASIDAKAEITVICSSDEEYPDIVPCIFEKIKGKSIIAVAGYPKNSIVALKNFGVKHFIHTKSNILESLKEFQSELGI